MGDDQKMANSRGISMLFYDRNETQKYIVAVVAAIQPYYYFEGRAIMCKRRASNGKSKIQTRLFFEREAGEYTIINN